MLTIVVMPCLDEVNYVRNTIASLGFLETAPPEPDTRLVVVDNGSTDGTLELLERLRATAPSSMDVVVESKRGYVPPRRRGVREAERIAASLGFGADATLILQADADTTYREGYIPTMRRAAADRRGVILEGSTKPPPSFVGRHPDYVAAQRIVDDRIERLYATDDDEVVLDDKVCGYRLSDYLSWGGLFEERSPLGHSIHAETTRMFVRARILCGARKLRVDPAGAMPSRRKIVEDPWLQYATGGFPREASWIASCRREAGLVRDVDAFARSVLQGREPEATRLRAAHQFVLFRYLPALVSVIEGRVRPIDLPVDVQRVLCLSAIPSAEHMAQTPGAAIMALLGLIDREPRIFPSIK